MCTPSAIAASTSLAAVVGMAVFRVAFERWIDETNHRDLRQLLRESLDQLKAVTSAG